MTVRYIHHCCRCDNASDGKGKYTRQGKVQAKRTTMGIIFVIAITREDKKSDMIKKNGSIQSLLPD